MVPSLENWGSGLKIFCGMYMYMYIHVCMNMDTAC